MKKVIIIVFAAFLAAAIGISVLFIINSGDKLVSASVQELEGETYLLEIDTEKQELDTRCTLSVRKQ